MQLCHMIPLPEFQSTPPVKAATALSSGISFSSTISIHAAREGGDLQRAKAQDPRRGFQSTPPVKAATKHVKPQPKQPGISIHAAREGGDVKKSAVRTS